jgi:predicted short-subunit dehydrogenase-like oxidoreductase (DUF2520 family)
MESHISAAEAALTFPEVIDRVHSRGDVFVVEREGKAICRIEPIVVTRSTIRDFIRIVSEGQRADGAYLDVVEEVARNQPAFSETPWG